MQKERAFEMKNVRNSDNELTSSMNGVFYVSKMCNSRPCEFTNQNSHWRWVFGPSVRFTDTAEEWSLCSPKMVQYAYTRDLFRGTVQVYNVCATNNTGGYQDQPWIKFEAVEKVCLCRVCTCVCVCVMCVPPPDLATTRSNCPEHVNYYPIP